MFNPLKILITKEMFDRATERDCGQMNRNSFMKGRGNIVGFLGEELVQSLSPDFKLVDGYDYDFEFRGLKVDVKTKRQTVAFAPKPDYEASIAQESLHQKANCYIFCRVYQDPKTKEYPFGWILGAISKMRYFEMSRKLEKGQKDGNNGFVVVNDCHNLEYRLLSPIEDVLEFHGK
jgi:hypothetical protein